MPDPTGDNNQIPPWILPYVQPRDTAALTSKTAVVLLGVVFQQIASALSNPGLKKDLAAAAAKFIDAAIDDCGSTGFRLRIPPHIGFLTSAGQLSRLADTTQNAKFQESLNGAAKELMDRARANVRWSSQGGKVSVRSVGSRRVAKTRKGKG